MTDAGWYFEAEKVAEMLVILVGKPNIAMRKPLKTPNICRSISNFPCIYSKSLRFPFVHQDMEGITVRLACAVMVKYLQATPTAELLLFLHGCKLYNKRFFDFWIISTIYVLGISLQRDFDRFWIISTIYLEKIFEVDVHFCRWIRFLAMGAE